MDEKEKIKIDEEERIKGILEIFSGQSFGTASNILLDDGDDNFQKIKDKIDQNFKKEISYQCDSGSINTYKSAYEADLLSFILKKELSSKIKPTQTYFASIRDKPMILIDAVNEHTWKGLFNKESLENRDKIKNLLRLPNPNIVYTYQDAYNPRGIKENIEKWTKAKTAYDYDEGLGLLLDCKPAKIIFNRTYDVLLGKKEEPIMKIYPDSSDILFENTIEDSVAKQWEITISGRFPALKLTKKEENK